MNLVIILVYLLQIPMDCNKSNILKCLAYGPRNHAMSYTGYTINGKRFHIKDVDMATQNYGVSLEATTMCRSSAKDQSQVVDVVAFYGVLREIILIDYYEFQLPLFKCDWASVNRGIRDEDRFTLVNLHHGQHDFRKDPFILASQAKLVFYSRDTDDSDWYVVINAPTRGFYGLELCDSNEDSSVPFIPITGQVNEDNENDDISYVRGDCEGILV